MKTIKSRKKINFIIISFFLSIYSQAVFPVEFNLDVLDSKSRENINFNLFKETGYILPGTYELNLELNGERVGGKTYPIEFMEDNSDNTDEEKVKIPQPCLTDNIVSLLGLKKSVLTKIKKWDNDNCYDLKSLTGVDITPKTNKGILLINIPQTWLEYTSSTWLPSSRWEDGVTGFMLDYNVNTSVLKPKKSGSIKSISYNGTLGYNLGAWRFRSDYQGSYTDNSGYSGGNNRWEFVRTYAYRALRDIKSNLTIGENFINSNIFNSWRYTGISLESDDRMLSPELRGYAPQISGIAETNSRVLVKHQGQVVYDTTVPAGPFSIQNLSSSIRGKLDVEIIEQDGKVNTFQIDTAYVPYLTRPGQLRYKVVSGRSRDKMHSTEGPIFTSIEAAYGLNNRWTLYGGSILAGKFNSLAVGFGRDLLKFGALSADITQSYANISGNSKQGKSWRLSYSKRFDNLDADITFAGYRFNERNYMTMQNYLDARYRHDFTGKEKELYTINVNKGFYDYNMSISGQYSHQTYWGEKSSDYFSLNINKYLDLFTLKDVSINLSASRSKFLGKNNNVFFVRASIPLGINNGHLYYDSSKNSNYYSHNIGYSNTSDSNLANYNINLGYGHGNEGANNSSFSGYYSRYTSVANISTNTTYSNQNGSSIGFSANGGLTITGKGAALHSGGFNGGTRLLVDTDGVSGVPIDGGRVKTNRWGIGVVTDINSYYRNQTSIDLTKLPNDIEAQGAGAIVESSLTEGAIGYRKFDVLKGEKAFAVIRLKNNNPPPFGSLVKNKNGRELGIVGDDGLVWMSGVNSNEEVIVTWGNGECNTMLPNEIKNKMLLSCN